jgi:general secretion pathway protein A
MAVMDDSVDWEFFGLREAPFSATPDPSYLYLTMAHEGALSNLYYGIGGRKGFMMITGEVGTGKTTLCRALLGQLDQKVHRALVLSSNLDRDELVRLIVTDFALSRSDGGRVEGLEDLNRFLVERLSRGENAVLIIDEAQNLPDSTLEEIRLISNLETEREKLIQIILVGQPELREKLTQPHLRQLDQRIAVKYHLRPLSRKETEGYVRHRLKTASAGSVPELFSAAAIREIFRGSGGYPRLINTLCDRSLLEAYRARVKSVGPAHVRASLESFRAESPPAPRFRMRWGLAVAVAALAGILLGRWGIERGGEEGAKESPPPVVAARPLPSPVAPPPSVAMSPDKTAPAATPVKEPAPVVESVGDEEEWGIVRPASPDETLTAAIATLFRLWEMDYLAEESRTWKIVNVNVALLKTFFRDMGIAEQYGVSLHARNPELERVRTLGLPCLFGYREPSGNGEYRYAVLAGLKGPEAIVYDPLSGRRVVSAAGLFEGLDSPLYYLLRGKGVAGVLRPGNRGSEVMALQEDLQKAGFFHGAPDGVFGPETVRAVRALQRRYGVEGDGVVGTETRLILSKVSGEKAPGLDDKR